ncbi:MAG TPA: hypothetical protein VLI69_07225 [Gammaproteobacteria bacterium]|nr:hypothetical protein [Gammaproteobacteria bacterium]
MAQQNLKKELIQIMEDLPIKPHYRAEFAAIIKHIEQGRIKIDNNPQKFDDFVSNLDENMPYLFDDTQENKNQYGRKGR